MKKIILLLVALVLAGCEVRFRGSVVDQPTQRLKTVELAGPFSMKRTFTEQCYDGTVYLVGYDSITVKFIHGQPARCGDVTQESVSVK